MTILEMTPLSLVEARELAESMDFVKKFEKIKYKEAEKLKNELQELGLSKVKEADVAKIIDLMPQDSSDINKIFVDVSLDEEEINKILEVVKKY
ncbi:MAG: hypothetical protein NT076_00810 [Candidatus Pacearchaeota archaeon]|nr:hypothetical protein [Candidatus Pacearchaeota archaeon]